MMSKKKYYDNEGDGEVTFGGAGKSNNTFWNSIGGAGGGGTTWIVPDSFSNSTITISMNDPNKISYKFAEDRIIADFKTYIDKTYGQHYKTEQKSIECFDAWIALGDSTPTFRNTALKYLWRYGKKNGSNKDDLMKTLHYVLMCLYVDHYKDGK
jgi:hypothetical protein